MQKCPYPGCNYIAAHVILNSHAKQHGFKNVEELRKKYGPTKEPAMNTRRFNHARMETASIHSASFNNIDSALAKTRKRK